MKQLKIDVYQYPSGTFLGTRFAPYREFLNGEKIISNADEVNSQVDDVRKTFNKKNSEVFFKTTVT